MGETVIIFDGLGSEVRNTSLLAGGASLVLLVIWHWWFPFSPVFSAMYVVLAVIAALSVPLFYRLTGYTLADELEWLEKREAVEHDELVRRVAELESQLASLGVNQGVKQSRTLSNILNDYHAVVETRFIGKKHSPLVYLSTARQVQKLAVQNLTDMVAVAHSLSTIKRQDRQDKKGRERQENLRVEQQSRLDDLLDQNKQLFDALTDTAVEVANMDSFGKFNRLETMTRLISLAEVASQT